MIEPVRGRQLKHSFLVSSETVMHLCRYSRSSVLSGHILDSCPLSLNSSQKDGCVCRKRTRVPYGTDYIRVLQCMHPDDYRGNPINAEEARQRAIDSTRAASKVPEIDMSETAVKQKTAKPGVDAPLWAGIDIPIIGLTGPKESGKTVFASTICPEQTLMIDCEGSSASYNLPYKRRVDLFAEMAARGIAEPKPIDAFETWKSICDAVKPGEYAVVVTDPWDFVQHGLHDWVLKNPGKFDKTAGQYAKASGLVWGDLKNWLHMYLMMLARKCNTGHGNGSVAMICHEGVEWKGGAPTGRMKTRGVDTIYQLASLFLNFERKPDSKGVVAREPSAYTCQSHRGKCRLMHTEMSGDGELLSTPILPPRLEKATPAMIRKYIQKPCDYNKLKTAELAVPQSLSEDDKLEMKAQIAATELETAQLQAAARAEAQEREERLIKAREQQAARVAAAQKQIGQMQSLNAGEQEPVPVAEKMPDLDVDGNEVPEIDMGDEEVPFTASIKAVLDKELGGFCTEQSVAPSKKFEPAPEVKPPVWQVIEDQRRELGITDADWIGKILAKRGVKTTTDLPEPEAESIRKTLYEKLTKRDMEASAGKSTSGK